MLFDGIGEQDPIRTLLEKEPPPLLERAPHIPPTVAEVVQRAILKEPDERWDSAATFRDALHQALRLAF